MRNLAAGLLLGCLAAAPTLSPAQAPAEDREVYRRGVVGLQVTYQTWDEDRPWAKKTPGFRNAAAVLVDDAHLLTTAQMISHATFIQLVTFGRTRQVEPRVVRVDSSINLALLEVDDPAALEGLSPVLVARESPTSGDLRTVRWRGQQLEAAASRLIRFEVERSWGSHVEHAFVHMRTDMAGAGWAEPVFNDGHLVGITVSQSKREISRAIPAEILDAFLRRASGDGPYRSFAALGVMWQVNRDAAVSKFLGQQGEPRGVLVRQVPWGASACGVLEPRDILLSLDGNPIDAEGSYRHPRLGRLKFDNLMALDHLPGDGVPAKVLRDGVERELQLTARTYPAALDLIPSLRDGPPPYVIAGGLVLRELDVPYLRTWGQEWTREAPVSLLTRYYFGQGAQTPEQRRWVLIARVLPSPYNIGYQHLRDQVVERINGRPVGGLRDAVAALENPRDRFHVIDLTPESTRGRIVLDAPRFEAATARILEDYQIPAAVRLSQIPLPEGGGECSGDF